MIVQAVGMNVKNYHHTINQLGPQQI